jgi:hypothetical protein
MRPAADASANNTPSMIVAGPALLLFMWTLLLMDRARVERSRGRQNSKQRATHDDRCAHRGAARIY